TVEKTASDVELCFRALNKIAEVMDKAGNTKTATYATLSLDALVSEAMPTGQLSGGSDNSCAKDKDDDDKEDDKKEKKDGPKKGVNPFAKKDDKDDEDDEEDEDDDDKGDVFDF